MENLRPIDTLAENREYLISYKILDSSRFPQETVQENSFNVSSKEVIALWTALFNMPPNHCFDFQCLFNHTENNGTLETAVNITTSSKELLDAYLKKAGINLK